MTEAKALLEALSFTEAKEVKGIELGTGGGDRYYADIIIGKSIRLYGDRHGSEFDLTFKMGDLAEYDSYNYSYLGQIVGITAKTVTIQPAYGIPTSLEDYRPDKEERKRRLKLYDFAWRNYNFDMKKINKNNKKVGMEI